MLNKARRCFFVKLNNMVCCYSKPLNNVGRCFSKKLNNMVCCYFQQLFKLAEIAIYQITQHTDAITGLCNGVMYE
jgi:hypothetical protein